jgi:hypothetical protein
VDENIPAKYGLDIEAESDEEVKILPRIRHGEALTLCVNYAYMRNNKRQAFERF